MTANRPLPRRGVCTRKFHPCQLKGRSEDRGGWARIRVSARHQRRPKATHHQTHHVLASARCQWHPTQRIQSQPSPPTASPICRPKKTKEDGISTSLLQMRTGVSPGRRSIRGGRVIFHLAYHFGSVPFLACGPVKPRRRTHGLDRMCFWWKQSNASAGVPGAESRSPVGGSGSHGQISGESPARAKKLITLKRCG